MRVVVLFMANGDDVRKGLYRHFKGKEYRVIGVARHSETLEKLVIYQALYESEKFGNNALWVRPISLFLMMKTVGDKKVPAFEFLREE